MSTSTEHAAYTTTDVMPQTFGLYIHYVSDWDKATAFFRDTLGWTELFNEPNAWAEFQTGGIRFALHGLNEGETLQPRDTHLSFFVKDVDESIAALQAKGVTITKQPQTVCEGVRSASFADPFGFEFHISGK